MGPDCIPVGGSNVLSHSHDEYDVFLKTKSRLVNRNLWGLSYQYVLSYLFYYHHYYYYYYCYYLIIYLFFTAHPAILVLRPIPSWTTSIFIGQTIPSFAVDTHPLLPMRTIFVTCLLGLLKIACFFAGEATSLRSCSTVPTAIETGICVADQVCLAAKKGSCSKL